jgi:pentatricopeptide repeat protein
MEAFHDILGTIITSHATVNELTEADLENGMKYLSYRDQMSGPIYEALCDIIKARNLDPSVFEYHMYFQMYGPFNLQKTLSFLDTMEQVDKIKPTGSTYRVSLRNLAFQRDVDGVKKLLSIMAEKGIPMEPSHHHAVLRSFIAAKKFMMAFEYFQKLEASIQELPIESWNMMLAAFAGPKGFKQFLTILHNLMHQQRVQPDRFTWNIMIQLAVSLREFDIVEDLIHRMKDVGLPVSTDTYTIVINGKFRANDAEAAMALFDRMERDHVTLSTDTFNCMIHHSARLGLFRNTLRYYELFLAKGHRPNRTTYHVLISALVDANDMESATAHFRDLTMSKIKLTRYIYDEMVRGFARRGDVENMMKYFNWMKTSGVVPTHQTYEHIVTGYLNREDLLSASLWVYKFYKSKTAAQSLSVELHKRIIQRYLETGKPEDAMDHLGRYISKIKVKPTKKLFRPLVQYFLRRRDPTNYRGLMTLFERTRQLPPPVAYRIQLALCGQSPNDPTAQQLADETYQTMLSHGYQLNTFVFNHMLKMSYKRPVMFAKYLTEMQNAEVPSDSFTYEYLLLHALRERRNLQLAWNIWSEYLSRLEEGSINESGKSTPQSKLRPEIARQMLVGCVLLNSERNAKDVLETCERNGLDILDGVPESFTVAYGEIIDKLRIPLT